MDTLTFTEVESIDDPEVMPLEMRDICRRAISMRHDPRAGSRQRPIPLVVRYRVAESPEAAFVIAADPGRYGVAWGGPIAWTDADSHEDALLRYAGVHGRTMSP